MTDVAALGLVVDSTQVVAATTDLNKLAGSAKSAEKVVKDLGNAANDTNKGLKDTSDKSNDAAKGLDKMADSGKKVEAVSKGIASGIVAAMAATVAYAGAMAIMAKNAIDAADAMNDLHLKTGLSFQSLAKYDLLASQSGTTTNGVAMAFKNLSKYIVSHGDTLKSLGVTSRNTDVAMGQFADVISSIQDPVIRTSLAMQVLGRSGADMLPMLAGGSAGFAEAAANSDEYGKVLERIAPQADAFNDKLAIMVQSFKTIGAETAESMLPALNDIADTFLRVQKESGTFMAFLASIGAAERALVGLEINDKKLRESKVSELLDEKRALNSKKGKGYGRVEQALGHPDQDKKRMADISAELKALTDIDNNAMFKAGREAFEKRTAAEKAEAAVTAALALEAGKKAAAARKKVQDKEQNDWERYQADLARFEESKADASVRAAQKEESEFEKRMRERKAVRDKDNKDYEKELKKSADASEEFQKKVEHNIGDVLYQSLSGSFVNIADLFKKMLLRMVADAAANRIMVSMGATMYGTAANAAGGAATQGLLGTGGVAGGGSAIFGTAATTAGVAGATTTTAGTGFVGGWGAYGASTGGTVAGASAAAGGGTGATLGASAAAVAPYAVVAVAAYVLAKYGFGMGNKRENVGSAYMSGNVSSGGLVDARMAQKWEKKGGWFSNDESGVDYTEMSKALKNRLTNDARSIEDVFVAYGNAIGDASIATKSYVVDVNNMANGIGSQLVPELEKFRMEGETLVETAQRMTQAIKATNDYLLSLKDSAAQQFTDAINAKNALKEVAQSIRDFSKTLRPSSTAVLGNNFFGVNALAAGGDLKAQGKLQSSATDYLSSAMNSAGSAVEYARALATVQGALENTASAIDGKATIAEQQLSEIQKSNVFLAGIDIKTGLTVDNTSKLDNSIMLLTRSLTMSATMTALSGAVGAANFNPANVTTSIDPTTGAVSASTKTDRYTTKTASTLGGVTSMSETFNNKLYWQDKVAQYTSALDAAWRAPMYSYERIGGWMGKLGVRELRPIPSYWTNIQSESANLNNAQAELAKYDVGTNYINQDQVAMVHKGEEIKPAVYVDRDKAVKEEGNALLSSLKNEVAQLRQDNKAAQVAIATSSAKMVRLMDMWEGVGMPMSRTAL